MVVRAQYIGFIQFRHEESCRSFVHHHERTPAVLNGASIEVLMSDKDHIEHTPKGATSVLLANIGVDQGMRPDRPGAVHTDVIAHLYGFFEPQFPVVRVVLFEKSGLQKALVEFAAPQYAAAGKDARDGKCLQSGHLITLSESSVAAPLKVDPLNPKARDFTLRGPDAAAPAALAAAAPQAAPRAAADGKVVLVSNLPTDEKATLSALFNLFSTCGDVMRIKVLHNNPETALIEYRTASQANVSRQNLNGVPVLGRPVRVAVSSKNEVTMPVVAGEDPMHPDRYNQDFTRSTLHRFKRPGSRNYYHMHPPSRMIHVSNIPCDIPDAHIESLLVRVYDDTRSYTDPTTDSAPSSYYEPPYYQTFKTVGEKKMGLATFSSTAAAVAALMTLHGVPVPSSSEDGRSAASLMFSFGQQKRASDGGSSSGSPAAAGGLRVHSLGDGAEDLHSAAAAARRDPEDNRILLVNVGVEQHRAEDGAALEQLPDVLFHFFTQALGAKSVCRIVAFDKAGLWKGLVEFATQADAARARETMDGRYLRGGQLITITESSMLPPLKVDRGYARGRDYTTTAPVLYTPDSQAVVPAGATPAAAAAFSHPVDTPPSSPVVLVSNLPTDGSVTCRGLFNLFSTCGDVMRVKILHHNRSTALIEYRNASQASMARQSLNNVPVFGKGVRINASSKQEVAMPAGEDPERLNEDFSACDLHRFRREGSKNFNHIHPPSHLLHFSNIPVEISDYEVENAIRTIADGQFYSFRTTPSEKKMGIATMQGVHAAVVVLMKLHGFPLPGYQTSSLRITFGKP